MVWGRLLRGYLNWFFVVSICVCILVDPLLCEVTVWYFMWFLDFGGLEGCLFARGDV